MTPALSPDLKSIFGQALEQPSPAERAAFLDRACGPNAAVRAEVEGLLAAIDQAGGFLRQPAAPAATVDPPSRTERAGAVIAGRYKLREQIGEGGMGTVWVAEQTEPVKRRVALKLIKPGLDSRQVQARFEAERQALALMDHPNIARVFDGGVTDEGRPYFVMELVHGVPITRYCDENRLTPRERLELFVPVCQAIQHAHQKGIIHRDIKPTNVLVTHYDDQAAAKVIDFGVAKATEQRLAESTVYTQFGTMVGTFEYMSPEQAEMNALGVDTRSDIYSLGVLLYELLTGTTPLERSRLQTAALDELIRLIREEEPPLPSVRLSSAQPLASLAASRKMEPARLSRLMRGELDWIVMKCLEKDRKRRYETASGLARDIERYLHDEPVEACPPSTLYLLQKTANKYRGALATAAGFVALLIAGTAFIAWQAVRARNAEQAALISEQKAVANEQAARENEKAARENEQLAEEQRDAATKAQQSALQEKNNALAAREEQRETLYAAEMNLVQAAVEGKQYGRAAQLLQQQRPAAGQPDFRGFEWHYWDRKLRPAWIRSVEAPAIASKYTGWNGTRSISRDGARWAALVSYADESATAAGPRLLAMVDGITGRELLAPFDPFPELQGIRVVKQRLLSMSGDGSWLAVALSDKDTRNDPRPGRISIREVATGKETRRLEVPGLIYGVDLAPDGGRIAVEYGAVANVKARSGESEIGVWDTSSGQMLRTLPLLPWTRRHGRILWSPDGGRLLRHSVASEGGEDNPPYREFIQIVDGTSGEKLWQRELAGVTDPHYAWSWSRDGRLLVIYEGAEAGPATKDNLQLWDGNTGTTLAVLDHTATHVHNSNIAFSPDGRLLAVGNGANEVRVWELPQPPFSNGPHPFHLTSPRLVLISEKFVLGLAFSADGRELLGLDSDSSIVTWDAANREDAGLGPESFHAYFDAAFSDDATKVAFNNSRYGSDEGSFHTVWDLASNHEACRLKADGRVTGGPVFSHDGRRVAMFRRARDPDSSAPPDEPQIIVYDAQAGEVVRAIPVGATDSLHVLDDISSVVFRPDGAQIAALIPAPRKRGEPPTTRPKGPMQLAAWELATGKQLFSIPIDARRARALRYTSGGASLVMGTNDDVDPAAILIWDATTGERQQPIALAVGLTLLAMETKHGVFLAQAGVDLVIGDLATGQERLRLPAAHNQQLTYYQISPDGSRIALAQITGSGDSGELTLWSLKSGRRLLSFRHEGWLRAMRFSPDGNKLLAAIAQPQGTIKPIKPIQIWDATPLPEEP